jgi:hypothetical protein
VRDWRVVLCLFSRLCSSSRRLGSERGSFAYAPDDERSFQIKYGSKASYYDSNVHELWQDPLGMFTTLLIGIDPDGGICISAARSSTARPSFSSG